MKPAYFLKVDGRLVIADVEELIGHGYAIRRINTPQELRGRGYASRVLRQIIADADREGVRLYLEPAATGGLSQTQLVAWYRRHGFKKYDNMFMARAVGGR